MAMSEFEKSRMQSRTYGPLFLYSTSPSPHERLILEWAKRRRLTTGARVRAIVVQSPLEVPASDTIPRLAQHFAGLGVEVAFADSGLDAREDAYRSEVYEGLATADLILVTDGSPERLSQTTLDTPALEALTLASHTGAVVAGCSAGAMAVGRGMLEGRGQERHPIVLWNWLSRTVIAPHYGRYDLQPWLRAFPDCSVLGIPDDGMALILPGSTRVESLGPQPLVILRGVDTPPVTVPPGHVAEIGERYDRY